MDKPLTFSISKNRVNTLSMALESGPYTEGFTLALPCAGSLSQPGSDLSTVEPWLAQIKEAVFSTGKTQNSSVIILWGPEIQLVLTPPFPVEQSLILANLSLSPLNDILARELVLGVVLLRLGRYAVGVFKGDCLIDSKVGARYVHGRHKKGGSSQARFQRIRQNQARDIYVKACKVAREKLAPYFDELDYLFLGGENHTINSFQKECPFLQGLMDKLEDRLLPVREPKLAELQGISREIWMTRVRVFSWPVDFSFQWKN